MGFEAIGGLRRVGCRRSGSGGDFSAGSLRTRQWKEPDGRLSLRRRMLWGVLHLDGSRRPSILWGQRVVQPVAEQVETDDHRDDREARP